MDIIRITVRWTGFLGAPGYSNFHFGVGTGWFDGGIFGDSQQADIDNAASRVANAFGALGASLPEDVQLDIEPEVPILDAASGETLGAGDTTATITQQPRGSGGYSAASGAVVNWRTNDYRFGRRIRGRTFIVPLAGTAYEEDGTIRSGALGVLRTFGEDIRDAGVGPDFGVWSRPRDGSGGVFASVTGSSVPDMAAVLRSRRD